MPQTLMAIGGAMRPDGAVLAKFYAQCGGCSGHVVILPTASGDAEAGEREAAALQVLGLQAAPVILPVRSREQAQRDEYIQIIENASGIFLCGGNQMRLTALMAGTSLLAAIRRAYQNGCTVAGTSAGAAALSAVMMAYGQSGQAPRHGIVQLAPGLGLIDEVIFDQHFNQRNRLGRLIYVVTTTPSLLGIGVDENTAALFNEGQVIAIGAGGVTIVDGSQLSDSTTAELEKGQLAAFSKIELHLLTAGSKYDISTRKATLDKTYLSTA
jgi:cyanophycinase